MEKKRQIFEETLTKSFDNDNYLLFLRELFDNIELVAPNREMKPYNTFSAAVENYRHIANYTGEDNNKVALFSVCLKNDKNLENARSMQRSFVKNLLENSNCAGALVAFYTNGEQDKWRLSLVRMDYEFSKGKISEKLTPAKRYSYLVGKGEPCHTAKERLYPLFCSDEAKPGLDALEDAFSVEAVTKDFFDKYREKYLDLKEFLDGNEQFKAESEARGFDSEQFAKKLMGQIVFLYFIQKKGWLGVNAFPAKLTEREFKDGFYRPGRKPKELLPQVYKPQRDGFYHRDTAALLALSAEDEEVLSTLVKGDAWGSGPKDFMRHIFEGCKAAGKNFFDEYLEPLFYTGLNRNRGENAFFQPLHRRVPFLNGGLFEELDGYDWENNDFCIANELFSNVDIKGKREADGILDVFDRYNFTMAEDEPMEREVAIDPEMLGKVFENLLDVTDRKSKGAFYTPREIVHYMCQETIINYLSSKTAISDEDIRKFILYGEYFRDEDTKKTLAIDNATGRVLHDDEIYAHKHHMEFDKGKDLEIPASIFCFKENVNRLKEIDDLLANVKVVDPAVGSGAFPLGMLTEIVKARDTITSYMGIGLNGFQRMSLRSMRNIYRLKRETIKNCIFACDIEPSATDITKLRLWLSLVIDNQIMNEENDELGYTTKPRELPNLDCNIICGNSLIDEFEGVKLITENTALNNLSEGWQGTLDASILGKMINALIELQDKLYDEKDHVEKESLKRQIQDIYDKIILEQINVDPNLVDDYYKAMQKPSKPFILWQLYFPKVFRDNGGFDVVIGNPPYGIVFDDFLKVMYEAKYKSFKRNNDLYVAFYEKSFHMLTNEGVVSLITPNTYLIGEYFNQLRKMITSNMMIRKIVDYKNSEVFTDPTVYVAIGTFINKKANFPYSFQLENMNKRKVFDIFNIKMEKPSDKGIKPIHPLISKIIEKSNFILSEYYEVKDIGFNYWSKGRGKKRGDSIGKRILYSGKQENIDDIPFLKGRDIDRFIKTEPGNFLRHNYMDMLNEGDIFRFSPDIMVNTEKIIYRQTANKIIATIDEEGIYNDKTIHCIIPINKPIVNKLYLLALLNSRLFEFIYREISQEVEGRAFSQVKTVYVKQLPIVVAAKETSDKIIALVEEIMLKKQIGETTIDLQNEIDDIVYKLYDIDKQESVELMENR